MWSTSLVDVGDWVSQNRNRMLHTNLSNRIKWQIWWCYLIGRRLLSKKLWYQWKASKWCFIQTDSLQFEKSERNADFFAHLAFVYIIKVVVPPKTVIFNFIPCLVTFLPRYSTVSLVDNLKAGKITGKYCPLRKQGKYFPVSNNQVSRWPISGPALLIRPLTF